MYTIKQYRFALLHARKQEAGFVNKKLIHKLPWRIIDTRAYRERVEGDLNGSKRSNRRRTDGERRTRAKVGQQDKRKKYRLDESLSPSFPLLLSSPFPVPFPLSLFFPLTEQCAEKCAIGEKNGPLPLWSSGPLELFCFHLRKGASYRGNCAEWIGAREGERRSEKARQHEREREERELSPLVA